VKALILAAGYATRLYPLTKEYPKSLLKVKNKLIIDHIVDKLKFIKELDEIIVVTNSKFITRFREWESGISIKKQITLVDDFTKNNAQRLGAIGDIWFVLKKNQIKEDLLVIGGDNLFSGGLNKFINFAGRNKPNVSIGLYNLKNLKDAARYGVVKIDNTNKVIEFREKPQNPASRLVAMCLYYIPRRYLKLVKDYIRIRKSTDATGNYIDWLKNRVDTYGFVFKGSWYDVGDHKYLSAAKRNFA